MDNKLLEEIKKENEGYYNEDLSRILSVNKEYKKLLQMFCDNKELQNLINYCIMDIKEEEEMYYVENRQYPSKRDSLMKLKYDLELARKARIIQELNTKEIEKEDKNEKV